MSAYNGRLVMEQVATRHGWTFEVVEPISIAPNEVVLYRAAGHSAIVIWTPHNTAPFISVASGSDEPREITGMGGLIQVRELIEANPQF